MVPLVGIIEIIAVGKAFGKLTSSILIIIIIIIIILAVVLFRFTAFFLL